MSSPLSSTLSITARRALAAVLLLSLLGACGEDRPERATTVGSDAAEQSAEQDGEVSAAEAPADPAGEQLTAEQIDAALLTVEDLPSGWTAEESEEDSDEESDETIEPAECQDVLDAVEEGTGDPADKGEADFTRGGPLGTFFSVTLSTYEDEVDDGTVQQIADAFTECPEFTTTDASGETTDVTVEPVSSANLGDETLAVAIEFESPEFTIPLNVTYVVVGHNVLTLMMGGLEGSDAAQLEDFAGLAVDKLESTTS